jgi:hypothetical protein
MCVNLSFYPLVQDSITGKKRVVFKRSYDLNEYEQIKTLSHQAFIDSKFYSAGFSGISSTEHFLKLVQIPCGYCSECLNSKAKGITFRIMKEAAEHSSNWFVTLTYDDEHLPHNYSLVQDEISKFNKKLKVYLTRAGKKSDFRFYGVGEYGSTTARPHYHIIYFGLELDDLTLYSKNDYGQLLYNSDFLSNVWSKGHVVIGEVDVASAAYVARYTEKKQILSKEEKQKFIDLGLVPEYSRQSMNPGIGANYFNNVVVSIQNQCYNENIKGCSFSFPKYYMDKVKKMLEFSPELLAYEKRSQLLASDRYSKLLLAYGSNYSSIVAFEVKEKKSAKRKRGN